MIELNQSFKLTGYTVIIPSIAVGNVSQLAIDLIVSSLQLKRFGSGYHHSCMPIFGPAAYEHDNANKTTSFEIYGDEKQKLLIFQIRSPIVSAYLDDFHKEIINFLTENEIIKLIILTSSHAYEKHSPNSPAFQYIQNDKYKIMPENEIKSEFLWKEFEGNVIYGGGNAKKLLNNCTINGIAGLILFKYVSEGDNSRDASQLVVELNKIFKIFEKEKVKITPPSSWNFLFGNNIPELIF